MKKEIKVVRDYWKKRSEAFILDTDVLTLCIETLSDTEKAVLLNHSEDCTEHTPEFIFVVNKVFNRHNDVCCGVTTFEEIKGGYRIDITVASSITELDISLETLKNCNDNYIFHIQDISKEILPTLTLEAIADVTAAVITYNNNTDN